MIFGNSHWIGKELECNRWVDRWRQRQQEGVRRQRIRRERKGDGG
jgi:hypothetical protein